MLLEIGVFIFTITKFAHRESEASSQKTVSPKKKALHIKRKSPNLETAKTIYSFSSFNAFCDFCTFLDKSNYKDKLSKFAKGASLYEYNSNYYLILAKVNLSLDVTKFVCNAITEFAHFVDNSDLFERKIMEYGTLIIKRDAITTCTKYFV